MRGAKSERPLRVLVFMRTAWHLGSLRAYHFREDYPPVPGPEGVPCRQENFPNVGSASHQVIKALQLKSLILGSEGRNLWIAKQRLPEERNRIKAVVTTRDFAERYAAAVGGQAV